MANPPATASSAQTAAPGLAPPRVQPAALQRTLARLQTGGGRPWLHQEAARRMADRLPLVKIQPQVVLDWSGPFGASRELLRAVYPRSAHIAVVLVGQPPPPARRWWSRRRDSAVPAVEVGSAAGQLLWSNMRLHAEPDASSVFARWHASLAVGGFLMFSTLGPGSLAELRDIYRANDWGQPMAPLADMHDLGDQLVHAGFADPVMDQETVTLTWPDSAALLSELRGLGANLSPGRFPGLRTPRWRAQLEAALLETGRQAGDGRPRLSFELVYGHAFRVAAKPRVQGVTSVALDDLREMIRSGRR